MQTCIGLSFKSYQCRAAITVTHALKKGKNDKEGRKKGKLQISLFPEDIFF